MELMLTVAIMAILTAIAYPQFAALLRQSTEAKTKGNMGVLRSAISIYYGDLDGAYPVDNLHTLIPRYLQVIPMQDTRPYHGIDNSVGNGDSSDQITSRASWFYFSVLGDPWQGRVVVNCDHEDMRGQVWSTY